MAAVVTSPLELGNRLFDLYTQDEKYYTPTGVYHLLSLISTLYKWSSPFSTDLKFDSDYFENWEPLVDALSQRDLGTYFRLVLRVETIDALNLTPRFNRLVSGMRIIEESIKKLAAGKIAVFSTKSDERNARLRFTTNVKDGTPLFKESCIAWSARTKNMWNRHCSYCSADIVGVVTFINRTEKIDADRKIDGPIQCGSCNWVLYCSQTCFAADRPQHIHLECVMSCAAGNIKDNWSKWRKYVLDRKALPVGYEDVVLDENERVYNREFSVQMQMIRLVARLDSEVARNTDVGKAVLSLESNFHRMTAEKRAGILYWCSLMWNATPQNLKGRTKRKADARAGAHVEHFVSINHLVNLWCILLTNTFDFKLPQGISAKIIFMEGSLSNHSCAPTSKMKFEFERYARPAASHFALGDQAADEEVTTAYLGEPDTAIADADAVLTGSQSDIDFEATAGLPWTGKDRWYDPYWRRRALFSIWRFHCMCSRCMRDEKTILEDQRMSAAFYRVRGEIFHAASNTRKELYPEEASSVSQYEEEAGEFEFPDDENEDNVLPSLYETIVVSAGDVDNANGDGDEEFKGMDDSGEQKILPSEHEEVNWFRVFQSQDAAAKSPALLPSQPQPQPPQPEPEPTTAPFPLLDMSAGGLFKEDLKEAALERRRLFLEARSEAVQNEPALENYKHGTANKTPDRYGVTMPDGIAAVFGISRTEQSKLNRRYRTNDVFLDIGCGTGLVVAQIAATLQIPSMGIDFNTELVTIGRRFVENTLAPKLGDQFKQNCRLFNVDATSENSLEFYKQASIYYITSDNFQATIMEQVPGPGAGFVIRPKAMAVIDGLRFETLLPAILHQIAKAVLSAHEAGDKRQRCLVLSSPSGLDSSERATVSTGKLTGKRYPLSEGVPQVQITITNTVNIAVNWSQVPNTAIVYKIVVDAPALGN